MQTDNRNASDTNSDGQHECNGEHEVNASEGWFDAQCDIEQSHDNGYCSYAYNKRLERCENQRVAEGMWQKREQFASGLLCSGWHNFPTQSPICSRNDELSDRLDNITFSKWRQESIKGYGNAVVPELVFTIFQAIEKYEMMDAQNNKQ